MSEALERSQLLKKEEVQQDRETKELHKERMVVKLMDQFQEIWLKK